MRPSEHGAGVGDGSVTYGAQPPGGPWSALAPIANPGGKVAKISAGVELCVLREDGAVLCGDPSKTLTMVPALGPGSAVDVAAGDAFSTFPASCARTTMGDVRCWGRDEQGAMGSGMPEATKLPLKTSAGVTTSTGSSASGRSFPRALPSR